MASLRQERTKNHQRNILATPQLLADTQQFTEENLPFRNSLDAAKGCPAWQNRGDGKDRKKAET